MTKDEAGHFFAELVCECLMEGFSLTIFTGEEPNGKPSRSPAMKLAKALDAYGWNEEAEKVRKQVAR